MNANSKGDWRNFTPGTFYPFVKGSPLMEETPLGPSKIPKLGIMHPPSSDKIQVEEVLKAFRCISIVAALTQQLDLHGENVWWGADGRIHVGDYDVCSVTMRPEDMIAAYCLPGFLGPFGFVGGLPEGLSYILPFLNRARDLAGEIFSEEDGEVYRRIEYLNQFESKIGEIMRSGRTFDLGMPDIGKIKKSFPSPSLAFAKTLVAAVPVTGGSRFLDKSIVRGIIANLKPKLTPREGVWVEKDLSARLERQRNFLEGMEYFDEELRGEESANFPEEISPTEPASSQDIHSPRGTSDVLYAAGRAVVGIK
jgi:hypothetical protein